MIEFLRKYKDLMRIKVLERETGITEYSLTNAIHNYDCKNNIINEKVIAYFEQVFIDYKKYKRQCSPVDKENILNEKIERLGFSPRTINALESNKIKKLSKLIPFNEKELKKKRGIGKIVMEDIDRVLGFYGLKLKT